MIPLYLAPITIMAILAAIVGFYCRLSDPEWSGFFFGKRFRVLRAGSGSFVFFGVIVSAICAISAVSAVPSSSWTGSLEGLRYLR